MDTILIKDADSQYTYDQSKPRVLQSASQSSLGEQKETPWKKRLPGSGRLTRVE